jgi:aconitate hydratase
VSSDRLTLTAKLLRSHVRDGRLQPGRGVTVDVDQVLIEDATGVMTCLQFEALGPDARVRVPLAVLYVDHNVLQLDNRNMSDHHYLESFSARHGLLYSRPGNGISHSIHLERFARPGQVLVGADSHSTTSGAVGMLALGAGGLDVALAMAGHGFTLPAPIVRQVELRGELSPWVQAKDVVLELLRRHGVRAGLGRVFEFTGPGVAGLTVTERATICNMIVETGATGAVFPSDAQTRRWLEAQGRAGDWVELGADSGAAYDESETIELDRLEPLVALPSSPGNVVPVSEVAGTPVVQVCVGSSVNSSYEDLAVVAAALRGGRVARGVDLTVTPGSRQILHTIVASGVYADLLLAGARMLEPICGPCIGVGQAPAKGRPSARTFNRNFPGRSGTLDDQVYLCSPATAAATAVHGALTDPRALGDPPALAAPRPEPGVDDLQLVQPPLPPERERIQVRRAPTIVPPPEGRPLPATISERVTIVVGDDVSTGDMAPDGAIGMAVWSDIAACARYMFRRQDPGFHDRAMAWGGGLIVGGHNYGQGSSREQAALAPLHLGIRAVVAISFARIHRRNLIGQGILPLVFSDEHDHEQAETGQTWTIAGIRSAVTSGATQVTADADGRPVMLRIELDDDERATVAAGGLLCQLRLQTGRGARG